MEGDQKRLKESKSPEGEERNPKPIQEYEFFVQGGSAGTGAPTLRDRDADGMKKKNGGQINSGLFFSSIEESDI